jgi:hypothetical protein
MTAENISPNSPAPVAPAAAEQTVSSPDPIAQKMAAMREQTQRNQLRATEQEQSGDTAKARARSPEALDEPRITSDEDRHIDRMPEESAPEEEGDGFILEEDEPNPAQEVSDAPDDNSTPDELIDFIDFAETNPNAKFKFLRNGKEIIIDAKRAAAILGQGGAIHEEARQLKIQRAEFDDYLKEQKTQQEGLMLAMEFTVAPQLQQAYDEIVKTQRYNQVFAEQLQRTQDPAEYAKIQANMAQNERYMRQQGEMIQRVRPNIEHFKNIRKQQAQAQVEANRKVFKDKELRNEYVFNEMRGKLGKLWKEADAEIVPGIRNLDLITSDETLASLIRDGLKFRDRPTARQAGSSIASLTSRTGGKTPADRGGEDQVSKLREQAKQGGKAGRQAADNLLMAQLTRLRSARTGR